MLWQCHRRLWCQLNEINEWLDANSGADGWAMIPAGFRGVVDDAVAIYFLDPASAAGFVARWCAATKIEIAGGAFKIHEDEPVQRLPLKHHKTP